jgi:FlaA1/EpsC-like NDP-sugar epimerase
MGKPVRILDLARQLIELSGRVPDRDIRIEFTGLRPGEKLFEELSYAGENVTPTSHHKIKRLLCSAAPLPQVRQLMTELVRQSDFLDPDPLKRLLKWAVPEYQPQFAEVPLEPTAKANGSIAIQSVPEKAELLTPGLLARF